MQTQTKREVKLKLEYQNYIEQPPVAPNQLFGSACSNDNITIETWRPVWIKNVLTNKKKFGKFADHSVGSLFQTQKHKPVIIAGSGPSLAYNVEELKKRGDICLVSCLHNYHFFEDRGVKPEYYVSLDAGPVVLEEVSEGGQKTPEEYWESTKDKTLIAFIGSNPGLFEKWQGKVYLFNAPIPDTQYLNATESEEKFSVYVSNGGNVLGACLYIAKGILGGGAIGFIGADFAFGYDKRFHGWDSKYDKNLGHAVRATDIFGNGILTWQSYYNFKNWFDFIAITVPGIYINCTEGGIFGAYRDGNIMAIKQQPLSDFINMFNLSDNIRSSCLNPELDEKKILF